MRLGQTLSVTVRASAPGGATDASRCMKHGYPRTFNFLALPQTAECGCGGDLLFLYTSTLARKTPDRDPVEPPSGATSFQTRALHGWRHHAGPNWAVGLGQVFHVWRRDDMVPGIRAQLDIVMGQGLGPIYLMLVPTAGLSWSCSPGPSSRSVARSSD